MKTKLYKILLNVFGKLINLFKIQCGFLTLKMPQSLQKLSGANKPTIPTWFFNLVFSVYIGLEIIKWTQRRSFLMYYFNIFNTTNSLQLPNTVTIKSHFGNRIVKLLMILFTSKNVTRKQFTYLTFCLLFIFTNSVFLIIYSS